MAAVIEELSRLHRTPGTRTPNSPSDVEDDSEWSYYTDLLAIAASTNDASVVPVLLDAIDVGEPVASALARFGDLAAPGLLAKVRQREDAGFLVSGLFALRLTLVRNPRLSAVSRRAILDVAREHLVGRQHSAVVAEAIAVAGAGGDLLALPMLKRIEMSASPSGSGLALVDATPFWNKCRGAARTAIMSISASK